MKERCNFILYFLLESKNVICPYSCTFIYLVAALASNVTFFTYTKYFKKPEIWEDCDLFANILYIGWFWYILSEPGAIYSTLSLHDVQFCCL